MDLLTAQKLKALIDTKDATCLSIFLPTFISGKEVEQNSIRFKNLVRQAEEKLHQRGLRLAELEDLLKPIRAYVDDTLFWKYQSNGLAIFRSATEFHTFRLPLDFNELTFVSDRFYVKPLLPLFNASGEYFLLAFSKGRIRLLKGSRFGAAEIDVAAVPKSLAEALKFDVYSKELQFQTGAPRHGGKRDAIFFGGGSNEGDVKKELKQYFQKVDKGIKEYVTNPRAPLVLAGVDYLIPIYKEVNKHSHLVPQHISGNPDDLSPQLLHEKAWELVAPIFYQDQSKALEKLKQLHGSGSNLVTMEIEHVATAAINKRIDVLFVANDIQMLGKFDSDTNAVSVNESPSTGDEDLLDFASVHTLDNGGTVYPMPLKKMYHQKPVAALLRF